MPALSSRVAELTGASIGIGRQAQRVPDLPVNIFRLGSFISFLLRFEDSSEKTYADQRDDQEKSLFLDGALNSLDIPDKRQIQEAKFGLGIGDEDLFDLADVFVANPAAMALLQRIFPVPGQVAYGAALGGGAVKTTKASKKG